MKKNIRKLVSFLTKALIVCAYVTVGLGHPEDFHAFLAILFKFIGVTAMTALMLCCIAMKKAFEIPIGPFGNQRDTFKNEILYCLKNRVTKLGQLRYFTRSLYFTLWLVPSIALASLSEVNHGTYMFQEYDNLLDLECTHAYCELIRQRQEDITRFQEFHDFMAHEKEVLAHGDWKVTGVHISKWYERVDWVIAFPVILFGTTLIIDWWFFV